MNKIVLVIFYNIIEYIEIIKEKLENKGYIVESYPLYKYGYDINDKSSKYIDDFINFINVNNISNILWIFLDNVECIKKIKSSCPNIINIFHNFDDPINFNKDLIEKLNYLDIVTIPFDHNDDIYKLYSPNIKIYINPPPYDERIFFEISENELLDESLKFDVAIIIDKKIDKNNPEFEYMNNILQDIKGCSIKNNFTFGFFGDDIYEKIYPDIYDGNINQFDIINLYNNTKIVICIHLKENGKFIFNNHVLYSLACNTITLVDEYPYSDMFKDNKLYYTFDINNAGQQIINILNDYDNIKNNKDIDKNYIKNIFSWDSWVSRLDNFICENKTI